MVPPELSGCALTVVIPAYNAAPTVGGAIASVLGQAAPGVTAVVVDDGSTDDTLGAIGPYQGPRVRLVRLARNGGLAAARNAGVALCQTPFVGFLDADDLLLPGWAGSVLALLEAGADIAVTDALVVDATNGAHLGRYYDKVAFPPARRQSSAILADNFVISTAAVRRSALPRGPFDVRLRRAEDWELWIRMLRAGSRVARDHQVYSVRRQGHASLSADRVAMVRQEIALLERVRSEVSSPRDLVAWRRGFRHRRARDALLRADALASNRPTTSSLVRLGACVALGSPRGAWRALSDLVTRPGGAPARAAGTTGPRASERPGAT